MPLRLARSGLLPEGGSLLPLVLSAGLLAVVLPPMLFMVVTSLSASSGGLESHFAGLANYVSVLRSAGSGLWWNTVSFAVGSSLLALVIGVPAAWAVARTDAAFRELALVAALLSLAIPVIIKGIGWILLLGPNAGLVNTAIQALFGLPAAPIQLFTIGGMIVIEALLWSPIVFLLTLPALQSMDPSLEEAASMAGATLTQTVRYITLPLIRPSVLAVFLLTFIRALESFEVPLLVGVPGGVQTFTTAIFSTIDSGIIPRYGEASAYSTLLILVVIPPLLLYYRATSESKKFATVTGKGFRPRRLRLGRLRVPVSLWLLIMPLLLAAPLLMLFLVSFVPVYTASLAQNLASLTLANYAHILQRVAIVSALKNSLLVGVLSASLVAGATFLLAWVVVRRRERVRWAIDVIASLPLVFPGIVLGLAVLITFLNVRLLPLYGTVWILVFAFLVRFMPYGMRYAYAGILSIHVELEEGARVGGGSTLTVLRRVVLPLARPAVLSAWIYVFLVSVRDLSMSVLLAGPRSQVVSVVILDLWDNGELPQLAAFSTCLAALLAGLGLLLSRLGRPDEVGI